VRWFTLAVQRYLPVQSLAAYEGTPEIQSIASAIKEGAEAFLRRQNRTILVIGLGVAVLIFLLYAVVRPPTPHDPATPMNMAIATTLAFLFGAFCSGIARYIGMFGFHPGQPPTPPPVPASPHPAPPNPPRRR